jgi:O-antigen/teichoic acid export membrane protein
MPANPANPYSRWAAAWVIAGRLIGITITLAANILAARVLGPEQFGLFVLITTWMAFGSILAMGGLNEAGLRFVAESLALARHDMARAYMRQLWRLAAVWSLIAAVLSAGASVLVPALPAGFSSPVVLAALMVVGVLALAGQQIAAELLRGWHELRLASLFSGGQSGGLVSNLL